MAEEQSQGNIKQELNSANIGLNLDNTLNQIKQGTLTYALNAAVENFDSSSVNYQNEQGNELCVTFPKEYVLIGTHFINEQSKHIFFITNPNTGDSEIGYMDNNDCIYSSLVSPCAFGWVSICSAWVAVGLSGWWLYFHCGLGKPRGFVGGFNHVRGL